MSRRQPRARCKEPFLRRRLDPHALKIAPTPGYRRCPVDPFVHEGYSFDAITTHTSSVYRKRPGVRRSVGRSDTGLPWCQTLDYRAAVSVTYDGACSLDPSNGMTSITPRVPLWFSNNATARYCGRRVMFARCASCAMRWRASDKRQAFSGVISSA